MDPDVALRSLQALLLKTPYSRPARQAANDILDAIREWLFVGGFEPLWESCPEAGHVVRSGGFFLVG
jgi:hypothetical protein